MPAFLQKNIGISFFYGKTQPGKSIKTDFMDSNNKVFPE